MTPIKKITKPAEAESTENSTQQQQAGQGTTGISQTAPVPAIPPTIINHYYPAPRRHRSVAVSGQWMVVMIIALLVIALFGTFLYLLGGCGSKTGCSTKNIWNTWNTKTVNKTVNNGTKSAAKTPAAKAPKSAPAAPVVPKPTCTPQPSAQPAPVTVAEVQQGPTQAEIDAANQAAYDKEALAQARVDAEAQRRAEAEQRRADEAQRKHERNMEIIATIGRTASRMTGGRYGQYRDYDRSSADCSYIDPHHPLNCVVRQNDGMVQSLGDLARRRQREMIRQSRDSNGTYGDQ